jgi:hypothetical protein
VAREINHVVHQGSGEEGYHGVELQPDDGFTAGSVPQVPSKPAQRASLKKSHVYRSFCLQVDHSQFDDAERTIHSAKDRFYRLITGLVANYGGVPLGWKGD